MILVQNDFYGLFRTSPIIAFSCDFAPIQAVKAKIAHTPAASTKEKEVAATCETDGSYEEVVKCSVCGEEISRKTVSVKATGHDWGEWVQTKAPSEIEEGEYTRTCKNDDTHKEMRLIPITAHTHVTSHVAEAPATCTTDGTKAYYKCSGCDLLFEDSEAAKIITDEQSLVIKGGHKGGTATCIHKAVCDVCHEEYGEPDSSNHAGETEVKGNVAATCTAAGFSGDTYCKDCGALISNGEGIPAAGHTPAEAVKENEVAATCTTAGSYDEVIDCSVCGDEISRETKTVSALGHDYKEVDQSARAATCTEAGKAADKKCSRCDDVITGSAIDPTGHDFGNWEVKKQPTETEEGVEERVCKNDAAHKETRAIAKLEPKPVTDDKGNTPAGDHTTPAATDDPKTTDTPAATDDPKTTDTPAKTDPSKTTETPAAKDTTLMDESTKATFIVTSSAGEEPTVEYKASGETTNKTVSLVNKRCKHI